jgi:ABC-type multidrug transport system ATPase subunit
MNNIYSEETVIVRFKDLTRRFGNFTAVSNLNLDIHKGEIVGLLGPNGAGKSTTMKLMAFLIHPSEGEIWIRNNENRNNGKLEKLTNASKDYLLDNFGFLIENPAFYDDVTPRQILSYFAELRGYPKHLTKKRVEDILALVELSDWIDKPIKTFSKGMRQKVGIVSTIVHDPQVIVLDEPQTGLDPKARIDIRKFIMALKGLGKTIFLSSHQLYEVSEVADRVAIISKGKLIAFDTVENLEAKTKSSLIQLETNPHHFEESEAQEVSKKILQIIENLTGLDKEKNSVKYNQHSEIFEILFNGDHKNQSRILKSLVAGLAGVTEVSGVAGDIEILNYSVPKAGLLEDLYLSLVEHQEGAL